MNKHVFTFSLLFIAMTMVPTTYAVKVIDQDTQTQTTSTTPGVILARVRLLEKELGLIQQAIGKEKSGQIIIIAKGVTVRELYFEAQSLFQKADRLAFEVTGKTTRLPALTDKNITIEDIMKLVNRSLEKIKSIKQALNIPTKDKPINVVNNATFSDIFNSILKSNKTINSLLYHRFTPSDVFSQITLSINYTQELLKRFPRQLDLIKTPSLIKNKKPKDVYKLLLKCFEVLQAIGKQLGINMLSIKVNDKNLKGVLPGDVYDFSKIIVAEVQYLNITIPGHYEHFEAYYSGYKTPSEVYQQASLLLSQLELLKLLVDSDMNFPSSAAK